MSGNHIRTLRVGGTGKPSFALGGMAISPVGTAMAVSNSHENNVKVYTLPGGVMRAVFGEYGREPGQFARPGKLCFSPLTGLMLITDGDNRRVQVCTTWLHSPCTLIRSSVWAVYHMTTCVFLSVGDVA